MADTAYLNLTYKTNSTFLLKNSWISPIKVRLMKFKFKKAILYCDENEGIHKIKIFIKNKSRSQYNIKMPEINLSEPLSELVSYVHRSIVNGNNKIFENNLNINITKTLEKLA